MTDSLSFKATGFLLVLLFTSCNLEPQTYVKNTSSGGALGTSYNIIYLTPNEIDLQQQIDSIFRVMNNSLSTYIPSSDISRINQGSLEIEVDHMFQEVFALSKEIHINTNGYFDPTVGALVNAWGFGPGRKIDMDSVRVDSIMSFVGFNKVQLNEKNQVLKDVPNIYLDFNAIAKGYAIDRLANLMGNMMIEDYLLEVGGELVGKGINQIKKKPWVVGIDDPQIEQGRSLKILMELKDKALASSGNYRKFRIDSVSGKKYVHTIDPKTGFTKNASTLGVTIIANDCARADAYATAFMAMDVIEAKTILSKDSEIEGYIIYLDELGVTQEFMTDGFKSLVLD